MREIDGVERRCPFCDQTLLADELTCWHCGRLLPEALQPAPEAAQQEGQEARPQPSPAGIYAGLTALVIISALVVTIFLGTQPRLQAAEIALPDGWRVVVDRAETFSVYLPEAWHVLDSSVEEDAPQLRELLAQNEAYQAATLPLGGFVEDDEILLLATGAGDSVFLLVTKSAILNRITDQEAIGLARQADTTVLEANHVEHLNDSHAALRIELPQVGPNGLVCRQQFRPGAGFALLVALCSERGQLTQETADTILASFQRLEP